MLRAFGPHSRAARWSILSALLLVTACDGSDEAEGSDDHGHDDHGHDDHGHDHHHTEVITRVRLSFTPSGGGDPVVAEFFDPDGKGTMSGMTDPITLKKGVEYELALSLFNTLEDEEEEVTPEIRDEAEEHMVFIYGEGVRGPASTSSSALVAHSYADRESDYVDGAEAGGDLPVGLKNTITAESAGQGSSLSVMLRHLPATNDNPVKTADLPGVLANSEDLPGEADVNVKFELNVEAADR